MRQRLQYPAIRIPLIYLAVALPWVVLTDLLVRWAALPIGVENVIGSVKGAGFVLVTAGLLYLLIARALHRVEVERDRSAASEARFRSLVGSFDDLVFTTDTYQRITDLVSTDGAEADRLRVIGKTPLEMFGPEIGRSMMEVGRRALAGETVTLDWFAETAPPIFPLSDDVTSLSIVFGPLRGADGAIIGTIGVGRDMSRIRDLERQQDQFEGRISHLQSYDALTGLPGRVLLESRLREAIAIADRDHGSVGVFTLNLDDFKDINDSLGHEVGDEVLQAVAKRLAGVVGYQDTLARLSGDEFAIVRTISDDAPIEDYVREVLGVFESPIHAAGQNIYTSAAIGIARYPRDASSASDMLRAADTAMFDAKKARSGFAFFHTGLADDARDRLALANELRRALIDDEITVAYQPIVRATDGRILAFEALARWKSRTRGEVPPAIFIPVAERAGIIDDLGRAVRTSAYRWLLQCHAAGFTDVQIEVNVSPYHFRSGSIERLIQEAEVTGIDPRHVILELTESALMETRGSMKSMLDELRDRGFGLAVDDFGTGYSSLAYLARLPVTVLKIAQEFVPGFEQEGNRVVIETAVEIARRLGLQTIVEGVEEPGQADYLVSVGVEYIQGYLFGRPVPPEDALEVLRESRIPV